jgi:hypothetical protein
MLPVSFFAHFLLLTAPTEGHDALLVLRAPLDSDAKEISERAYHSIHDALSKRNNKLLPPQETFERLTGHSYGKVHTLQSIQAMEKQANTLYAIGDLELGIKKMQQVIGLLVEDVAITTEKRVLLQKLRIGTARRLLALGGQEETGAGETSEGRQALQLLKDAKRTNPKLYLEKQRHPPRMRRLFHHAKRQLFRDKPEGIWVQSEPVGAKVIVEGHIVGITPLKLKRGFFPGRYRVWIESENRRSLTRTVQLGAKPVKLHVDLVTEHRFLPDVPGLQMAKDQPLDPDQIRAMAKKLRADRVFLMGVHPRGQETFLFTAVYSADFDTIRIGRAVSLEVTDRDDSEILAAVDGMLIPTADTTSVDFWIPPPLSGLIQSGQNTKAKTEKLHDE